MRSARVWLFATVCAVLAACSHTPPEVTESVVVKKPLAGKQAAPAAAANPASTGGTQYTVEKGDTLYSIAFRYGLDFRTVAALNGIREPYTIYPGQVLTIKSRGQPAPLRGERVVSVGAASTAIADKTANSAPLSSTPPEAPKTPAVQKPSPSPEKSVPAPKPVEPALASTAAKASIVAAAAVPKPVTAMPEKPAPAVESGPVQTRLVGGGLWQWPAPARLLSRFTSAGIGPKGISLAGESGDPVRAARDGRVVYTGSSLVGYGQLVIVKHDDVYLSAYAHNSRVLVKEGDGVKAGQKIAEMGSTGTDRTKLHFEVRRNGDPVDPLSVLPIL